MSHLNPGLISAYNSLTDKHLAGYFSNTRIRRHLQRAGLITRSGRIVPDKEYRHKLIQRAHQRHVRECLAQAIFHKVLEMERLHQIEIKRKLEEFARRERVHKIKVERARRYEEDIIRILSPRPPTGARGIRKQHSGPEGEHSESSESPGSSRPNTAPGKMQRPVRLKPIHSNSTTASVRRSSPHKLFDSSNENDPSFNCTMDKESRRRLTAMETSNGISPYCLPVINNFVTPVPPATKRKDRGVKVIPSGTLRGRRLRPTTASSGADVNEDLPMLRSSIHQSRVCVNMVYFGKTVHLSHDLTDMRDEVKVFQQHCGGENLCVYKGKLREGESFQFISRRHRGFPFSLTFFLNGLQVERLSSCCEFKHRKGSRLGGRHGHFGVSGVEGASPCYKCIIAMGLDKKPTPPPKRVKEDGGREDSIASPKDAPEMETERTAEDAASHSERETRQRQVTETQVKAETAAEEDHVRDDYEEDFEADDEGPVEDAKEKKSPSPSSETETRDKEKDASETEDEAKDEDIESRSGSSCSGSDREVSDAEATRDSREDEKAEQPDEAEQVEATAAAEEKAEPNPEEDAATKDSDLQDSAGDSTEIDISDTSVPSGTENKQSDDTSADKEAEKTSGGGKQEEEGQEQERAKSVQEKLAEAILKESHCSSEPELSDTSTEEEEVASVKGHEQKNNDVIPEQQQDQKALVEETKNEESVDVGEVEMVQDHEETSKPKAQEPETEKETHENSDSAKDESKIVEDDEKPASEEEEAENDKSLDTRAALHTVVEENTSEENKSSETREDAAATDDAAQKDEENEEETAEADAQPDETEQGAKSGGEDESSVSDPNKKTNETAVSDNAEAEVMTASETVEMKAEPSEEREALSCEEAPVTDKEERQEGDSKNRTEASETEVTTEKSSSLFEGNRETTVENTADVSENKVKDEDGQDDVKDEEVEEASGAEGSKDGNQEIMEEEQTEKSVEIDKEEVEKEKSEELNKEEEKQTNPEETPEGESSEKKENETDKTEEEENNGSKAEERIEDEENIVEESKSDTNTEGQEEEPAEKILDKEDKVAVEPRADESEKTEINEGSESVENKNDEEEPEAEKTAADKSDEGEDVNEIKMDADEEKDEEAEKEGKNDDETKTEQDESEMNKDGKESEEIKPVERDEISEITDEPEKHAEEVKVSNENAVESEDIGDSEAPDGTKMGVEVLNNVIESEDVKEANTNNEKEQVDAENGEISPRAERATYEEKPEASTEAKNDVKTSDHVEEETTDIKTEKEPTEDESAEVKEGSVTRGDDAEKQDDDKVDQTPDTDVVESEAEGVDSNEKQDEYAQKETAQETDATEVKEGCKPDSVNPGREEGEGSKQDENGNKSVLDDKNKDSDSIEKSDNNVNEVIVPPLLSAEEAQSVAPIESAIMSDKRPPSEENAAVAANADLSAADGENGADTEEASKASEEGASILLKPQQNNEADDAEKSITIGKETSEALAAQDSTDLVSNWVTVHQMSKYFQTFVEPLEDLKEEASQTQESVTSNVASKSTELPRSESPLKTVNLTSENVEKDEQEDETEVREKSEVEAVESNLESKHSQDIEPHENSPAKDTVEEVEETEVKDLIPKTETGDDEEEPTKEQRKGSEVSLKEDKVLESGTLPSETQNEVSKTEVESIVDAHHSGGKPESVAENQTEEKRTDHGPELNEKQAETEEMKDFREQSESLHELKDAGEEMSGKTDGEKSREVTEITEFTTPRSEDGSQEETHHGEIQPKPSGGSVNGERRDVQLIQDIKHTLSKDRLSTFSVDETLFGHSSYPLLTAARTESGH